VTVRLIAEFMGERREHRLREGTTVIGRDPSCNIVFSDPSLSRRHLECTFESGRILVRDLNTKNGTFLGSQRIEEARLPPGVPLRAGNVWLRFETEEHEEVLAASASVPSPGTERGATTPPGPLSDIESRVPASENYEQDEEPTPGVDEPALAPRSVPGDGTEDAARVVVRDNRWYLRDAETGSEVEIVPVQKGGAAPRSGSGDGGAAAPPGAQLPARIIRRDETLPARPAVRALEPGRFGALMGDRKRRIRILLAALAAVIVLIVAAAVHHSMQPKPIPPLTRDQYNTLADRAVELFRTDPAAAMKQLQDLQQRPTEGNPKLAKILQEAFQADADAVKNFEKGYETALANWEEVHKSSERTEAANKLAGERREWLDSQMNELNYLSAARDAIKQGDYLKALNNAASLDKAGPYGKEAEALIQRATDAVSKAASAEAAQMHWTDAARQLRDLIKARLDLAESLQPKIAEYEQNETARVNVEEASRLVQAGKFAEAGPLLEKVGETGPYAQQAAALRVQIRQSDVVKNAKKAYDNGLGEQAVEMLKKAGLGDSQEAGRMRAVIAAKAKANDALQAGRFAAAKAAWEETLRLEPVQTNAYAQEAKRNLDSMAAKVKDYARKLIDQADDAFQNREYLTARNDYEEALKLDPANKEAKDGLARMAKSALKDFNRAIALPYDTLEQVNDALQKLQSARDRLLTDNPLYSQVDREITEVLRMKAELEKQGGQKGP
jgi:tetratricopeptide (TPR) repeat protein